MILREIWRYPVKSMRGQQKQQLEIKRRGFAYDRHWMLVDDAGRFLTQRQLPRMQLITPQVASARLTLKAAGMDDMQVPEQAQSQQNVRIWKDQVVAELMHDSCHQWLTEFLGVSCRLVRFPQHVTRPVDPVYARPADETSFADGFPFLIISQASLDELNRRLPEKVSMERFRPNLVIEGCEPYAEDEWQTIRIGGVEFNLVKPCSRCIIPTINPLNAEKTNKEPIATLSQYRKRDHKIYFGQNAVHDGKGILEQGMSVEIICARN